MKNIALLGFGKIGKKYFQTSLKSKSILINKILKKREINLSNSLKICVNLYEAFWNKVVNICIFYNPLSQVQNDRR